jgi:hypothetical protein
MVYMITLSKTPDNSNNALFHDKILSHSNVCNILHINFGALLSLYQNVVFGI